MVYLCMLTAYMCIFCYIVGTLRKYLMCISALFILGFCVLFASKIPCILMHISVMQKVRFFSAYSWVFRHGVCVIHAYLRRLVLQMSAYIRRRYFYTYYNLYSLFFCVLKSCDLYISAFFFIQNSWCHWSSTYHWQFYAGNRFHGKPEGIDKSQGDPDSLTPLLNNEFQFMSHSKCK